MPCSPLTLALLRGLACELRAALSNDVDGIFDSHAATRTRHAHYVAGIHILYGTPAALSCRVALLETRQIVVNNNNDDDEEFFKFKRRCLLKAYAKGKTTQQWGADNKQACGIQRRGWQGGSQENTMAACVVSLKKRRERRDETRRSTGSGLSMGVCVCAGVCVCLCH